MGYGWAKDNSYSFIKGNHINRSPFDKSWLLSSFDTPPVLDVDELFLGQVHVLVCKK